MPNLTVDKIASIIHGKIHDSASNMMNYNITSISIDSRTILDTDSTIFFALVGERNNGHKYIPDLVEKGVRLFVISKFEEDYKKFNSCSFIVVEDTLIALQQLATWIRTQYGGIVVGITGSNGKTIVKEWLFELLQGKKVLRSPKSYNSQVGVPLSVWHLDPGFDLAIFEAGISTVGEMQKLAGIIDPTVGIFTNIGPAHQEGFASEKEKIEEKLKLFEGCEKLIYCKDQSQIDNAINECSHFKSVQKIAWSLSDKNAAILINAEENGDSTILKTVFEGEEVTVTIPFKDEASVENASHCLAFVLSQGFYDAFVAHQFENLFPVAMRLELKEGINGCQLINDYYNSDINSLTIALNVQASYTQTPSAKKTVLLSDIRQSGIEEEQLYQEISRLLRLNKVNRFIGIGKSIMQYAGLFDFDSEFYSSTDDFLKSFESQKFNNECILLKGAREFHFERISSILQKKYHQTVLEIDLNKLVSNLNYYKSLIFPETKIMVMVKAFSYGSGTIEIARVLQYHKVDYLAVAVADEGIELRQNGIELPIVIMNPEEHSFESMIEYRLEPNIYSEEIFQLFRNVLARNAVSDYPVHIKIDTGMSRLGFDSEESIEQLAKEIENQSQMRVRSVFSHLAASDEEIHDKFTRDQIERFDRLSKILTTHLPYKVFLHILNSAGIERFPGFQFDMVRLGIGLYGVGATPDSNVGVIGTLRTTVSQIRKLKAGQTVGYGRRWKVEKDSEIAVLPIGYADGYNRKLSNGVGSVFINGKFAPVVGNICMDMCMIDVTGINVSVGDEVELMGEHVSVEDIANKIGTIPYEVLTGISQRVKRIYIQE